MITEKSTDQGGWKAWDPLSPISLVCQGMHPAPQRALKLRSRDDQVPPFREAELA